MAASSISCHLTILTLIHFLLKILLQYQIILSLLHGDAKVWKVFWMIEERWSIGWWDFWFFSLSRNVNINIIVNN